MSVAACTSSPSAPAATYKIRWGLIQSVDQLPFYVMQERGFAKRHGVELVEQVVAGGRAVVAGMAAGTLDAGYVGSLPMLVEAHGGTIPKAVVGVGAVAFADGDHRAFAVVVGSSVHTWRELAGRDIAVNQLGAIADVAVRLRLAGEGVTDVHRVEVSFPNQGLAVAGGNVAAAVMVEPYITQSLLRGDGRVLGWVVGGGEPFPEFEESLLTVRTDLVRRQPAAVKALLAAQLEAVRWIEDNDGEARSILARRLGLTDEVGRKLNFVRFSRDGRNDAALLSRIQDRLLAVDPGGPTLRVRDLYDETLLDGVLRGG